MDSPPSAERLRQARRAGQVAVSPLLVAAAALSGALAVLAFDGAAAWGRVIDLGRQAFSGQLSMEPATLPSVLGVLARAAGPILIGAWAAAWLVGLVQTRGLLTLGAFASRRRPPTPTRWLRWAAGLGGAIIVAGAARGLGIALARTHGSSTEVTGAVFTMLGRVLPRLLLLVLGVGLVELGRARSTLAASLRMTRSERQAEARREQGNPQLRAESRRRQRA